MGISQFCADGLAVVSSDEGRGPVFFSTPAMGGCPAERPAEGRGFLCAVRGFLCILRAKGQTPRPEYSASD